MFKTVQELSENNVDSSQFESFQTIARELQKVTAKTKFNSTSEAD